MLVGVVVIHAAPYSVHRNEDVFERAEEWSPERRIGERKEQVTEWFWSFGSVSRSCIGKAFACKAGFLPSGFMYAFLP